MSGWVAKVPDVGGETRCLIPATTFLSSLPCNCNNASGALETNTFISSKMSWSYTSHIFLRLFQFHFNLDFCLPITLHCIPVYSDTHAHFNSSHWIKISAVSSLSLCESFVYERGRNHYKNFRGRRSRTSHMSDQVQCYRTVRSSV